MDHSVLYKVKEQSVYTHGIQKYTIIKWTRETTAAIYFIILLTNIYETTYHKGKVVSIARAAYLCVKFPARSKNYWTLYH
jgi:hypothetical protein